MSQGREVDSAPLLNSPAPARPPAVLRREKRKMFARFRRKYDLTDIILWLIGAVLLIAIVYGSYVTLSSGKYTTAQWLNFVIFGLAQGGIYALIALGYTMVYGILGIINFAHGDFFMFGTFGAFFMAEYLDRIGLLDSNPLLAILLMLIAAMVVAAVTAVLSERMTRRIARCGEPVPGAADYGYCVAGFFGIHRPWPVWLRRGSVPQRVGPERGDDARPVEHPIHPDRRLSGDGHPAAHPLADGRQNQDRARDSFRS